MKRESPLAFDTDDCFELKPFSDRLERYIAVEHLFVEGSLVLALNGGFGSGKSTFIEMWQNSLIERRDRGEPVAMPVVLNAWESDHCGDPLVAILAGLIEVVENWKGSDAPDGSSLKDAVKDVGWFATGLANEFLAKAVGINAVKAAELAEKKKEGRTAKTPDFIGLYQERIAALRALKDELRLAFGGVLPKVIVFVDELDRCRPDYAVSFLETIKHVFDVEGIVFVLAVDYFHLSASAKALFGADLRFDDYFRKFSHRMFSLPKPDETGARKLSEKYVRYYLNVEGARNCIMAIEGRQVSQIVELLQKFEMPPRQVQEAFRVLGHLLTTEDIGKFGRLNWCIGAGALLLAAVRTADREIYGRILTEAITHEEIGRYLIAKLGIESAGWWYRVYITGAASHDDIPQVSVETLLRTLGLVTGEYDAQRDLVQFSHGWGHGFRFSEIIRRIESAETF